MIKKAFLEKLRSQSIYSIFYIPFLPYKVGLSSVLLSQKIFGRHLHISRTKFLPDLITERWLYTSVTLKMFNGHAANCDNFHTLAHEN